MVQIRQFRQYFESFLQESNLKSVILVAKEDDFSKKIKDLSPDKFPVLVVVIPSADGHGLNVDNYTDKNTSVLYVLSKIDSITDTDESKFGLLETTQQTIEEIKRKMISDASTPNHMFYRLDLNSLHTDPEYNYMGCDGWSLGFTF